MSRPAVAVVGAGRVGLSFARALALAGWQVEVLSRTDRSLPAELGHTVTCWPGTLAVSRMVMITVPDDAVAAVVSQLAADGTVGSEHVVLHCSGALDSTVLAPLADAGAATGSLHPLQSFPDEDGSPGLLVDVPAVVEGSAPALAAAREIAAACRMTPVIEMSADERSRYHAAAVFASNYLVALAGLVDRLARDSAIDHGIELFLPLMRQTLVNITEHGPAAALTGPIRRGDAGTVARHLEALDGEAQLLYRLLGREALALCEDQVAAGSLNELRRLLAD